MATALKPETLTSAMAGAFAEIEAATKGANNPHFKTKYADLGAVIDAIKPALIKHNLFFAQHSRPAEDGVSVETILYHAGGERESLGTLYVPANKRDAQGFGSALTYARRYALMTAFGVPAEDDDGNAAVRGGPARQNGKISETQLVELQGLANASGADLKRFCSLYKIDNLPELPASQFESARAQMQQKLAKKGASNGAAVN